MKIRYIVLSVLALLVFGCASSSLTPQESKALEEIVDVFIERDMSIIMPLSSHNKITAAVKGVVPLSEGHSQDDEHGHEEEKAILVLAATPDASGKYLQYVVQIGDNKYFYEVLYSATVENNLVVVTKTMAPKGSPARTDETPEADLLEDIAKRTAGKVNGNVVNLQ